MKIAYDIGANVGNCTAWFLSKGYDLVVSVEPDVKTFGNLYNRFCMDSRVLLLPVVISNTSGKIDFYESNCSTISTADDFWVSSSRFAGQYNWNKTKKNAITLTNMLNCFGTPDFIKVDVEGHELQVFKGLKEKVNCTIGFEWAEEKWDQIQETIQHLQSLGYADYAFTYADSLDESLNLTYKSWDSCEIHSDINPSRKDKWGMIYLR